MLWKKYLLPTYHLKIVIGCFRFFLVDVPKGHIFIVTRLRFSSFHEYFGV